MLRSAMEIESERLKGLQVRLNQATEERDAAILARDAAIIAYKAALMPQKDRA